ncbi:nuclear pore complex protein NUP1-like isoform X2 [Papaver somniferum]|uniref:nuclear pore complex protein NUP1-like isoform X2 n=1 Tax=Papaver somniferum TaxID=3469 RepID=UPI000E6FE6B4|nr:nuclear pore complex protein NUP1-like isoform X2 [Papaver somniferum]
MREEEEERLSVISMEKEEATTSKGFYGGGGVGGKLRKPPLRKPQSTPYARPPQQALARKNGGGWLSKIVDPATRIITGGVTRILPSAVSNVLFGSSEYDYHSGTEVNQDASDEIPEDISNISGSLEGEGSPREADRPKSVSDDDPSAGNKLGSSSDGSSFSDIEKKLKEATFSRHEYDRLTKLLHSRSSHVDERSMETSNTAIKKEATDGVLSQENLHEEKRAASPAPRPQLSIRDQVGASPIDIAKAYMGGHTSESGLDSQSVLLRDERTPITDRFSSRLSIPLPLPKPSVCWPGAMVQDQWAYQTPQTQNRRIGLHNLARTPYSRPTHSRSTSKLLSGGDRGINTMPNQWKQSHTPNFGFSQVARKTSSPDKGFGSLGPIRRTRRNSVETTPYRGTSLNRFESSDASMDILRINNQNHEIGPSTNADIDFQMANNIPPSSVGISPVHPQSSDVARRILEHLDRAIPTPQKKVNELKMASSWRKPQSSSDTGVLNGLTYEQPHVVEGSDAQKSPVTLQHSSKGKEVANSSPFEAQLVQKKVVVATTNEAKANTSATNSSSSTNGFGFGGTIGVKAATPSVGLFKPDAHRKPPTPHTSGRDKPALSSISITKRDPKCFDNGSGFTFLVSASSSGNISEPPTPSILPFPSASGLPRPQEKTSVPSDKSTVNAVGAPSYSFRSQKTEDPLVFSFPSTSSASPSGDSTTTPTFKFGSDKKDRISFRSFGENTKCH